MKRILTKDIRNKVKLSLCLIKHLAIKSYWGVEVQFHALTSALKGYEWSALRPGRFHLGVRTPDTRWLKSWMGPRTGFGAVAERKIPIIARIGNRH